MRTYLCTYTGYTQRRYRSYMLLQHTVFPLKIHHSKYSSPARNLSKYILIADKFPDFKFSSHHSNNSPDRKDIPIFRYKETTSRCASHGFSWKEPKYIVWVSVHSHNVPVVFIGTFLVADDFFPDYRRPGVFVNVITSNCCPYGEFNPRRFVSINVPNKALQGFAALSNDSSR